MSSGPIEEAICQAIISGNSRLLREYAYAMKTDKLSEGCFPEQRFDFLLRLLNQQEFLELGGAWCFIIVLGGDEDLLSDDQKARVLSALRFALEAFEEMNPELITEAICQAIAADSAAQMQECHQAISLSLPTSGPFPEHYFELLLRLLNQQEFLELEDGSSDMLSILMFEWETLSDSQKERLLPALESSYKAFKDWMSWFVISVLLGEYFADEKAFQTLCRLKTTEAENPRSLVPHGLEHIISDSGDIHLAKRACVELLLMKNDTSEQVRDAVNDSLKSLANQGIKCD